MYFTPIVHSMPKLKIHFRLVLVIYWFIFICTCTCLCIDAILACMLCLIHISEHRKMLAKQQHVCKEMNQYSLYIRSIPTGNGGRDISGTTYFLGPKQEGLAIVHFLNKLIVSCKEAVRFPFYFFGGGGGMRIISCFTWLVVG
jgi:hypothetical protein